MEIADHVTSCSRTIAAQVKYFRMMRGLSQAELGALCDMEQSTIARLENTADTHWTTPTLMRIAAALDCRADVQVLEK